MWPGLIEWARSSMLAAHPPLASRGDMKIPVCVDNADQAIARIRTHRKKWLAARTPHARRAGSRSP
jgi:hypothetical protein